MSRIDEIQRLKRAYVETSIGQIHYAQAGEGEALLLLHQSAQSWRIYARLAAILAARHRVVAIDLPGFGESSPMPRDFEVADVVRVIEQVLDGLGIEQSRVSGHHTGATLAVELAASRPDRVIAVAVSGYLYRTDVERERAIDALDRPVEQPPAPRFYLKADGSHLPRVFERISLRRWQSKVSAAGLQPPFPGVVLPFDQAQARPELTLDQDDVELINESIVDNLRAAPHGAVPINRALTLYDPGPRLPLVGAPALIIQSSGPFEPIYMQRADTVARLIPGGRSASIENGDIYVIHSRAEEYAGIVSGFFDSVA
jgi:pimeloyl-ACP methyl ester carboxylesterase